MTDRVERVASIGRDNIIALRPGIRVERASTSNEIQETLAELNAWISIVISLTGSKKLSEAMSFVQHDLLYLSDQIGLHPGPLLAHEHLARLDAAIARLEPADFSPDEDTIPSSTSTTAAFCSVARTVCRRAKRQLDDIADLYGAVGGAGAATPAGSLAHLYLGRLGVLLQIANHLETRPGA